MTAIFKKSDTHVSYF